MKQGDEFTVYDTICTLSDYVDKVGEHWTKEVRFIAWNGKTPVIDVRHWSENGERSEGIQFTQSEVLTLVKSIVPWIGKTKGNR